MEENLSKIKAIIGLGNPDPQYLDTYHNAGYEIINSLANQKELEESYKDFCYSKDNQIILAKTLTFMNQSGSAVKNIVKFFDLTPEEIMIVHDDSDLEIGSQKISFGRNSAGHKGVQSIIDHLKTKDFWRFRIGIRKKTPQRAKAEEFVLKKISKINRQKIYSATELLKEKLKLKSTSFPT